MYRQATEEEVIKINKGVFRKEGRNYDKQELLEISWVNVPALPSALVSAGKANFPLLVKELEGSKDELEPAKIEPTLDKDLIQKFITQQEQAISILKDLITPEKDAVLKTAIKGRVLPAKQKSKRTKMERLLIMFGKMVETLLKESRQQNEKERN